ncbi:MAG: peptide chain release factor N(5)-glutamine methyltransferase [Gaiellales bacterium]
MNVGEALQGAGAQLKAAGCASPHIDAELLLGHALGTGRTDLYADRGRVLSTAEEAVFEALVARRARREPLAYILGEWGFRGLTLAVGPQVLVPRPETEAVVERVLAHIEQLDEPLVLDIGTGSGAIALSVASEHPGARVVATDISADALAVAAENRSRTGLEGRVELVLGHLVAGVRGPFHLVVSNPPYVLPEEVDRLEPEVSQYEPREAVVGLGQTDAIARRALQVLRPGGWLLLESSEYRAADVGAELRALGYEEVAIHPDLAGRPRVVEGRLP